MAVILIHQQQNFKGNLIVQEGILKVPKLNTKAPIEKEVKQIDKNGEEITNNIPHRLEFIESARFMVS